MKDNAEYHLLSCLQTMFKRSPCLTYLYGALDTTPPPPKVSVDPLRVKTCFHLNFLPLTILGEEGEGAKGHTSNQGEGFGRH